MLIVTVSQLNRYVKAVLEEDTKLREVYVRGEIAGYSRNARSGHCYFKLADAGGSIRAVCFRSYAELLGFEPEDGLAVLARGSVGVYERDGAYQLYVTELMPDGAGALAVAFEQRKRKLEAMGLFDPARKRNLPAYPGRIGVVTSDSGAALHDIRTVLERRWPACTLVLSPARVQGAGAPESIVDALSSLDKYGNCDVILLARGGGSAEELWCFNDEAVVLTVAGCKTPVISAVGHETDVTLCDFAADARAPTPSAAAELAVPDRTELAARVTGLRRMLVSLSDAALSERRRALERARRHPSLRSPRDILKKSKERVDIYSKALYNSKRIIMQECRSRLGARAALLDGLSPLRVLERGYCIAVKDGAAVTGVETLREGDELELRFRNGHAGACVTRAVRKDVET